MTINVIQHDDIYDCFTMEHFRLRQRMTLTIKIYCSRLYILFYFYSNLFAYTHKCYLTAYCEIGNQTNWIVS
jgi:hypothetical protein